MVVFYIQMVRLIINKIGRVLGAAGGAFGLFGSSQPTWDIRGLYQNIQL